MTIDPDITSVEDALVQIQETSLHPERAGPLIRKNVNAGIDCEYRIKFTRDKNKTITCETQLFTTARPKFLGKVEGLS